MELTNMWDFVQNNQFIVGALTGSLAAYVLGLVVSHWRRERRWLGYSLSSRTIVSRGDSKLTMQYDERSIERLDSHTVVIRNIGNRALLRLPVRLASIDGGEIVDHDIHCALGVDFSATRHGRGELVVTLDLLNPGEVMTVGMTVADAKAGEVRVIARGEYLEVKHIGDRADIIEFLEAPILALPFGNALLAMHRLLTSHVRK